jgi:hypothetical protein
MNNTAIKLWEDKNFILKRIKEQESYLLDLHSRYKNNQIDLHRFNELANVALYQKLKFERQFMLLLYK